MKTSREKILQSALQLFMSMNYERVSLEMVSRSVGLTKTGIFNYYPSKLDLFVDVADHFLFGLQDPARKFAPSDGTVIDFIEKYVDGVRRTMDEIVRLGNVRRELMPGKLANAGYFHLFQQVLFYYPDGRQRLHELMESEYELWCRAIRGGGRTRRTGQRDRRRAGRRPLPPGLHRALLPDVLLRRPRRRAAQAAFPLYIWSAEAVAALPEPFFKNRSKNMTGWSYFCFFILSLHKQKMTNR